MIKGMDFADGVLKFSDTLQILIFLNSDYWL